MMARATTAPPTVLLEVAPRVAKMVLAATAPFQVQLQHVSASVLPEQTDDPVAALRALLEVQVLGVSSVGLLVGREACTMRTLELPSMDRNEMASMLELQLGKLTPYSRAEILSAWTVVGSFRDGYTTILLAIARKGFIDSILHFLQGKQINPQWIGVSTEGLESWWSWGAAHHKVVSSPQLAALIDVDAASTDCAILSNGKLLFTYSLAVGAEQLAASEEAKQRWLSEFGRLSRVLLHEDIKGQIGRGVMTGLTQHLPPLAEHLTGQWGVPVEVMDSLAPLAPSPAVSQSAAASRVSFAALAGVLVSGSPPRLDLMPPEIRVSQALHTRSKHLTRLAANLTLILVFAGTLYLERIVSLSYYQRRLQQRLTAVQQTSRDIIQRQRAMREIRGWLDPAHGPLEIFRSIAAASEPGIAVTQVTMGQGKPVVIRGRATTMALAFSFFDHLKQQGFFREIHTRSIGKAKGVDEAGADFEVVCDMAGAS